MSEPKRQIDKKAFHRHMDAAIVLYVKGVKRTGSRMDLYKVFQKAKLPMCADDIMREIKQNRKNVHQATVYRILAEFKRKKMIEKVGLNRRTFYEII